MKTCNNYIKTFFIKIIDNSKQTRFSLEIELRDFMIEQRHSQKKDLMSNEEQIRKGIYLLRFQFKHIPSSAISSSTFSVSFMKLFSPFSFNKI